MVPLDHFLAQRPDLADADEDALMVARIEHERAERETLEARRQELRKRKQSLIAENKKRKDDLASLDQDLEKFIDVSASRVNFCHAIRLLLCFETRTLTDMCILQAAKPIQKLLEKEY